MEFSITIQELGGLILFLLFSVATGFVIVFIRNFNCLVKEARSALAKNQAYIDGLAPDLTDISKNSAVISKELALGAHDVSETALTLNQAVGNLAGYAVGIKEFVRILRDLFMRDPKQG